MTIKERLNEAWKTNEVMGSIFEFRAVSETAYTVLQETVAKIDEIVAGASFADVDSEIKSEGQAIRQILNQAKEALDSHSKYILWRQPEG